MTKLERPPSILGTGKPPILWYAQRVVEDSQAIGLSMLQEIWASSSTSASGPIADWLGSLDQELVIELMVRFLQSETPYDQPLSLESLGFESVSTYAKGSRSLLTPTSVSYAQVVGVCARLYGMRMVQDLAGVAAITVARRSRKFSPSGSKMQA